jgi:hypothetical protein
MDLDSFFDFDIVLRLLGFWKRYRRRSEVSNVERNEEARNHVVGSYDS